MKTMVSHFENDFKDIEIVSEPLDIKSSLKEEDLPLIEKWQTISKRPLKLLKLKTYSNTRAAYLGGFSFYIPHFIRLKPSYDFWFISIY